jgi:hypothetical protein
MKMANIEAVTSPSAIFVGCPRSTTSLMASLLNAMSRLPELDATRGRLPRHQGKLKVRLGSESAVVAEPRQWLLQTRMPDGQPWMWAARHHDGYCRLRTDTVNRG